MLTFTDFLQTDYFVEARTLLGLHVECVELDTLDCELEDFCHTPK